MSPRIPGLGDRSWRDVAQSLGAVVLLLLVLAFLVTSFPALALADESYVVRSDSMAPAIGAGAVVFVEEVPTEQIEAGDVITFQSSGSGELITHRVVEVLDGDETRFRTKGDANEDPDPGSISAGQVIGAVSFHLPLIGYVVSFAGSSLGLVALVILPAVSLIVLELWDLATSNGSGGDRLR